MGSEHHNVILHNIHVHKHDRLAWPPLLYVSQCNTHFRYSTKEIKTIVHEFVLNYISFKLSYNTLIQAMCKDGLKLMNFE